MAAETLDYIGPDHQLPAPPRRHRWWILIVLLLLVILVVGYLWWRSGTAQAAAGAGRGGGAPTITVATAKTGNIGLYVEAIGTVTPVYTSSITSQVNGLVTKVYFQEGQVVKQDDPLIDIDSRPYEATLLQAQGILNRDQSLLAQAQMDLKRYQDAWARNAIPKQTLDDQEKLVDQDKGTVENDQGTYNYDLIQVKFCHITAPIAGRVGLRLVDPGNVVTSSSNTPLVVITQLNPITVVFTIPEDSIDLVQEHTTESAKLKVDALDRGGVKKLDSGHLLTLDNQIDTTTGTVKARAEFPNSKGLLFPNQFVNARLLVTMLKNVTLIPSSAVQHNEQVAYVYVIEDSTAHMQNITTGVTDGGNTEVKGINAGDVVANSGFERLQDKEKVSISTQSTTQPTTQQSSQSSAP